MQVSNRRVQAHGYTTYTLEAVIEGQSYAAQHIIPDGAYAALDVKDKNDLIESQLWQNLMHTLEHHLRKIAYAQTKDTDR